MDALTESDQDIADEQLRGRGEGPHDGLEVRATRIGAGRGLLARIEHEPLEAMVIRESRSTQQRKLHAWSSRAVMSHRRLAVRSSSARGHMTGSLCPWCVAGVERVATTVKVVGKDKALQRETGTRQQQCSQCARHHQGVAASESR